MGEWAGRGGMTSGAHDSIVFKGVADLEKGLDLNEWSAGEGARFELQRLPCRFGPRRDDDSSDGLTGLCSHGG